MITRISIFVATLVIGLGLLRYTLQWVSMVGKNAWAEEHLGMGGSYSLWKLIGVLIIIFGFLVLLGSVQLHPNESNIGGGVDNSATTNVR